MTDATLAPELDALRRGFQGTVIAPESDAYDDARAIFNSMIDKRPAVIAQCATSQDVIAALASARGNGLEIAVRSSGHSVAGAGVSEGGIVIDLRHMNAVEVDPERRTATVAGGATWSDVDHACQPHGLATTGGRVSTTGVAGLTLGGGSGWLERKFGLACDNLLSVELVTADGRIVTASEAENPDLFWALHGGGGNFGIATELVFSLHPLPVATFAFLLWRAERAREVAHCYRDLYEDGAPAELGGGIAYLTGPPEAFVPGHLQGRLCIAAVGVYAGPEPEARGAMAPILELRPEAELIAEMPWAEIQCAIDDPPGYRNYWSAEHLERFPDEAVELFCRQGEAMLTPSPSQHFTLPWGGAVAERAADWPLPHRGAAWVVHPFGVWESRDDDERVIAWARQACAELKPFATGAVYLNFVGDEGEDRVLAGYGRSNYERLVRIKGEYDPENLFRLNHNIRPAGS
jgi:FAD/FMN-containing dehydrogenase